MSTRRLDIRTRRRRLDIRTRFHVRIAAFTSRVDRKQVSLAMNPFHEFQHLATRRTFLGATAGALGTTALSSLLARAAIATTSSAPASAGGLKSERGLPSLPHFTPKAKRVLCLFQSEGFSHVDLFDNKSS